MTEMRVSYFVGFAPPPPLTPKYLTILKTERWGAIVFCRILAPPNDPPPQTPQYLTILQTERGAGITFSRILALPMPTSSLDATILNYLNDREGGAIILCRTLPPPPLPQTPQYLTILITVITVRGDGGANILYEVKFIRILLLIV